MYDSIREKIYQKAEQMGLRERCHQFMNSDYLYGFFHFYGSQVFKNYIYAPHINSIEDCAKIKIIKDDTNFARSLSCVAARKNIWSYHPSDAYFSLLMPAVVKIKYNNKEFIYWRISKWCNAHGRDLHYDLISFKLEDEADFLFVIKAFSKIQTKIDGVNKIVKVYGGENIEIGTKSSWNDLVLDENILRLTKQDIEGWIGAESRYKKLGVPYRRGYLFEGPPGNGKTAVSRTMICSYDFSAYSFDFSNVKLKNSDLQTAFGDAAKNAPSIFLMEDVDRLFVPGGNHGSVTLSGIFNCLDGVNTYDGVVTIATANKPEVLDAAFRLRPGRFDVPVRFNNPSCKLRYNYLRHLFSRCEMKIDDRTIYTVVDKTEGMSMAFVKSIFESAATSSAGQIDPQSILLATSRSLEYYNRMTTQKERNVGFVGQHKNSEEENYCEPPEGGSGVAEEKDDFADSTWPTSSD